MNRNFGESSGLPADGSAPSEAWLFAQAILGNPIPNLSQHLPASAASRRKQSELLAESSPEFAEELRQLDVAEVKARHDRELLEWAAAISPEAEQKLRVLESQEAEERESWRRAQEYAETLLEGTWDASKHPRVLKGQPGAGQWTGVGVVTPAGLRGIYSARLDKAGRQSEKSVIKLAAFAPIGPATWPSAGPASSMLPQIGSGAAKGVGAAAGIGAGAFLGALRNGSMGAYWARIPGAEAMPQIWVYELEKRVRAGNALARRRQRNIHHGCARCRSPGL